MMAENHFQQQIEAYDNWKSELIQAIEDYRQWIDSHNMDDDGSHALQIYEALDSLKKDRLNIAFVAEFSRGKTELINAIFFANYLRRLLPSSAGRTTMCPTELFYDREKQESYIRLLPIETRAEDATIAEYKEDPYQWTSIGLETDSPEQMQEALQEVVKTKRVSIEKAKRLGLFSEELYPQVSEQDSPQAIAIPMWRHALISFPHPLLQQGLVILDTPGLNALGNEPELTVNMLPAAQAILFVLAADTGVTRSDLEIWQHHIQGHRKSEMQRGVAVALNKIDTLWDELKDETAISTSIETQSKDTAEALGIEKGQIFPVSAQKGLVAKIKDDPQLLQQSGLDKLEAYLCEEILPKRVSILRDNIVHEIDAVLSTSKAVFLTRMEQNVKQYGELKSLGGKNQEVIQHLMKKTREEQTLYLKNVESFKSSQGLLKRQARSIMESLSLNAVDRLISTTRKSMVGSWTTSGLKKGMMTFFAGIREMMEQVDENAEHSRVLVNAIYKKFHEEHGLKTVEPKLLNLNKYMQHLDGLYLEGEAFRKSPVTTMTEQNFVIKKFFINLVSQARDVFFKANKETETWLTEVMRPLLTQIKEHKLAMEKQLETLRKINESRETLDIKLAQLEQEKQKLDSELNQLIDIQTRLNQPLPVDS